MDYRLQSIGRTTLLDRIALTGTQGPAFSYRVIAMIFNSTFIEIDEDKF